jgi:hypothetical protein
VKHTVYAYISDWNGIGRLRTVFLKAEEKAEKAHCRTVLGTWMRGTLLLHLDPSVERVIHKKISEALRTEFEEAMAEALRQQKIRLRDIRWTKEGRNRQICALIKEKIRRFSVKTRDGRSVVIQQFSRGSDTIAQCISGLPNCWITRKLLEEPKSFYGAEMPAHGITLVLADYILPEFVSCLRLKGLEPASGHAYFALYKNMVVTGTRLETIRVALRLGVKPEVAVLVESTENQKR